MNNLIDLEDKVLNMKLENTNRSNAINAGVLAQLKIIDKKTTSLIMGIKFDSFTLKTDNQNDLYVQNTEQKNNVQNITKLLILEEAKNICKREDRECEFDLISDLESELEELKNLGGDKEVFTLKNGDKIKKSEIAKKIILVSEVQIPMIKELLKDSSSSTYKELLKKLEDKEISKLKFERKAYDLFKRDLREEDKSIDFMKRRELWLIEERIKYLPELTEKINNLDPLSELMLDRAAFNLTKDESCLKKYLPVKNHIERNEPEKVAKYNDLIQLITKRTKIVYKTEVDANDTKINPDNIRNGKEADASTKYLTAANISEVFFNRPELIENLLNTRSSSLTITFTKNINNLGGAAGFYSNHTNIATIRSNDFLNALLHQKNNRKEEGTLIHEILHGVDWEKETNTDGCLPGLRDDPQQRMLKYRMAIYKKNKEELLSPEFNTYAFASQAEFLSVTIEMFYYNPAVLKASSKDLYNLYCEYFRFDPLKIYNGRIDEEKVPMAPKIQFENKSVVFNNLKKGNQITVTMANGVEYEYIFEEPILGGGYRAYGANKVSEIVVSSDGFKKKIPIEYILSIRLNNN